MQWFASRGTVTGSDSGLGWTKLVQALSSGKTNWGSVTVPVAGALSSEKQLLVRYNG